MENQEQNQVPEQNQEIVIKKFEEKYTPQSFWKKLRRTGARAGKELIEKALTLYYSARDEDTPKWARGIIYGTLGYFIAPLDFLPDVTPIAGFTDDLGVIISAFAIVAIYIKSQHKEMAHEKIDKWFGAA